MAVEGAPRPRFSFARGGGSEVKGDALPARDRVWHLWRLLVARSLAFLDKMATAILTSERAPLRRAVVAGGVSLFFHIVLFLTLAIASDTAPSDEFLMRDPDEDKPLEVVFSMAAPEPAPSDPVVSIAVPEAAATPAETHFLDPENLKVSEKAPDKAEIVASQHSEGIATTATAPPAAEQKAKEAKPEERADLAMSAVVEPAPTAATTAPGVVKVQEKETVAAIGAWKKGVGNAIGVRWDHYRSQRASALAVGSVRITFLIDAKGKVSDINVLSNTGNPDNALLAVRSAQEAKIPPIPAQRLSKLRGGRVEVELTLTILPNS